MRKRLMTMSFIGLSIGALLVHVITLLVNYFVRNKYLICMPALSESLGSSGAVIIQTVLGAVFGMVAIGGMCLFDIEKWSLLRASVVHCAFILVTYITVGLPLHWFSFDIIPLLIMAGIISSIYALIWLIIYVIWKREIRQMNCLAEEYIRDTDTDQRKIV